MTKLSGGLQSVKMYQYTECGLSDVYLHNVDVVQDDHGEETYRIINVLSLHKLIASVIIDRSRGSMTGEEFRFLRSEMGFTQEEMGKKLGRDRATIGRWERGAAIVGPAAETVMKLLAAEKLQIESDRSVEQMASDWTDAVAGTIRIDGEDPNNYQLLAA